jgi:hypothetical protein
MAKLPRIVRFWTPADVQKWLLRRKVSEDVAACLLRRDMDGEKLIGFYYEAQRALKKNTHGEMSDVYISIVEACEALDMRCWCLSKHDEQ